MFAYAVTGRISDLAIPAVVTAARKDELWRHICFEAFVGSPPDVAYYEFNFAPSTQWAACRFSGYRAGCALQPKSARPKSQWSLVLTVTSCEPR